MSTLTTTSSMGESMEEFDTRLSLRIGGPPPAQLDALFPAPPPALIRQPPSRKKKASPERPGAASARHSKKARTAAAAAAHDGGARKKLRLSEEQAALLESSFRAHNILSHAQKHELAREVKLSARQVEVWFQNRRARTKLKQTEVDCELLRRWCDSLSDENARLRRELAGVRSSAVPRLTAAAVCPSCDVRLSLGLVAGAAKMASR